MTLDERIAIALERIAEALETANKEAKLAKLTPIQKALVKP